MKTNETPAEAAATAGTPEAQYEAKLAEIERCHTALDARRLALFHKVFPIFVRKEHGRLRRRLSMWNVPAEEARELVQDVFFALFNHVVACGARHGLARLLGTITRGKLQHHARRRRRAPRTVAMPSTGSALPETAPDLERAVDYREAARRFLPQLPPAQRAVVAKCILEDKTLDEAAAELDIPEGTVISRLRAAKRALLILAALWLPPSQRAVTRR